MAILAAFLALMCAILGAAWWACAGEVERLREALREERACLAREAQRSAAAERALQLALAGQVRITRQACDIIARMHHVADILRARLAGWHLTADELEDELRAEVGGDYPTAATLFAAALRGRSPRAVS